MYKDWENRPAYVIDIETDGLDATVIHVMCWSCSGVLIFTLPRRPQLSQCQRTTLTISLRILPFGFAVDFFGRLMSVSGR